MADTLSPTRTLAREATPNTERDDENVAKACVFHAPEEELKEQDDVEVAALLDRREAGEHVRDLPGRARSQTKCTCRLRWYWYCLGLLASAATVLVDDAIVLRVFGRERRSVSCPDGKLDGGVIQMVCITGDTVVKVPRHCGRRRTIKKLIRCKWSYWGQLYVNNHWEIYSNSEVVPNVLSHDKSKGITFERIKLAEKPEDVTPDYMYNTEQLFILDAMLQKNGHIMMDLTPSNIPLDDSGRIHIIDFILLPAWMRSFVDRDGERQIPSYSNLYSGRHGRQDVLNRIAEEGEESLIIRQELGENKGSGGRGLRKGGSLD